MMEIGVVHGRFQVFHNDHLKYVTAAQAEVRHLVVGITNPDPVLTKADASDPNRSLPQANPLTYYERYQVINTVLANQGLSHSDFSVVPLPINFPELYHYYVPMNALFFLTIYDEWGKRKESFLRKMGLRTHILWEKRVDQKGIAGTEVRRRMANGENWRELVPESSVKLYEAWNIPERLSKMELQSRHFETME